MGRNKIQIRPLTNERNRQATFTKRKQGLLKKAMEFSILCGCQVSLLIVHENKLYEYSSHDMQQVLDEYPTYEKAHDSLSNDDYETNFGDKSKKKPERQTTTKETTPPKSQHKTGTNPTAHQSFYCATLAPPNGGHHPSHNGHREMNDGRYYGNMGHYPYSGPSHDGHHGGPLTPVSSESIKQANVRLTQMIMEKQEPHDYPNSRQLHSSMPNIAHPPPQWYHSPMPELHVSLADNVPSEPERSRTSRKRPLQELGLRITVPTNKKARAPVRLTEDSAMNGRVIEEHRSTENAVPATPEFPSLGPSVSLVSGTTQTTPRKTSPLPLTPIGCPDQPWPWTPTPKEISSNFTNFEYESHKQPCLSQPGYF